MSRTAQSYAKALMELHYTGKDIRQVQQLWECCPLLGEMLSSPIVSLAEKEAVIRKVFPERLQSFFCVLCRNTAIDCVPEMIQAFYETERQQNDCALAVVEYVTPLTETQQEGMKQIARKYSGKQEIMLSLRRNPDLLGGFVLRIGDFVYDRSVRHTLKILHKQLAGQ